MRIISIFPIQKMQIKRGDKFCRGNPRQTVRDANHHHNSGKKSNCWCACGPCPTIALCCARSCPVAIATRCRKDGSRNILLWDRCCRYFYPQDRMGGGWFRGKDVLFPAIFSSHRVSAAAFFMSFCGHFSELKYFFFLFPLFTVNNTQTNPSNHPLPSFSLNVVRRPRKLFYYEQGRKERKSSVRIAGSFQVSWRGRRMVFSFHS